MMPRLTISPGPGIPDLGPRTSGFGPRTSDVGLRTSDLGPRTSGPGILPVLFMRHGRLPPWDVRELPPPPIFTARNALRTVGPGVIGLGIAIGSGEWLIGPAVILKHGAALLWITSAAVVLQVVLNQEMGRYTLYTGEPIVTGFMRTWPGPGFWGTTYALFGLAQYGWPGWALASATATTALLLGRMPGSADAPTVIAIGYGTFALCFLLTLSGRKVERTLEYAMWTMVA